ncbi:MAG TPA: hypothetical protein VKV33_10825 [Streptosporangiaceae bacterium]|nr:hypothetical protein [Streptosporangiaceae bacterium]
MPDSTDPGRAGSSDYTRVLDGIRSLHDRMDELENFALPSGRAVTAEWRRAVPAWRRVTQGEPRWHVGIAMVAAICLQLPLPDRLVLIRPVWVLPAIQGLLLVIVGVLNPHRIDRESRLIRGLSLTLVSALSLANAWSAGRLVVGLVRGTQGNAAGPLLISGGIIWLTNVIVFALWYWEFDRGGPVARAHATRLYPDFQFVQMTTPQMAPPSWEPIFFDYLYLAFTNAAAFSPTDVMPLSRWAKAAMLVQSVVSIVTVALVVARAVNILR